MPVLKKHHDPIGRAVWDHLNGIIGESILVRTDIAEDEQSFLNRFQSTTNAIKKIPLIRGYCYTQLTDVQQEINGLLTDNRQPKIDLEKIRSINDGSWDVN